VRYDYRPFIGMEYVPPYGCLHLVQQVFQHCYGIDLDSLTGELSERDMSLRNILDCLTRHTREVDDAREGDVLLIRADPWHVGVVVEPGSMIHSYSGDGYGTAIIENYTGPRWGLNVRGIYRYVG